MKSCSFLAVSIWLLPSITLAQMAVQLGPRGEVAELRVGKTVYFTDIALSLVKPGWAGNIVDQQAADPTEVRIQKVGNVTTYTVNLHGEGVKVRMRERVTIADDEADLRYEIVPEQDVMTETVMLRGHMPTVTHAGKTSYFVDNDNSSNGLCPAELHRDRYVVYSGGAEWIGFVHPGDGALRVVPQGVALQYQDDRKWNTPAFSLLATCGGGKLPAGNPS
jgi:hypothetical protein